MKKYTVEEITAMAKIYPADLTPEEEALFDAKIEQAEHDITELKNNATVNFRWSEFEIKRAKKIAEKLGIPYQTYIKSTLKQAMDAYEQKQM